MLIAILQEMRTRLQNECPFEVRFAHIQKKIPENEPFVLLGADAVSADTSATEGDGKVHYPVTAVISVTAAVPSDRSTEELNRIFAAYIFPVMAAAGSSVCGFSQGNVTDHRLSDTHMMEVKFRLKGVYTIETEDEG